jgi:hypothetical protein
MPSYTKRNAPYAGLREERRSRRTGARVALFEAAPAGYDDEGGRWVTVCETHGTICNHETLELARFHLPMCEWCEECMELLEAKDLDDD